jgi:hypothetical protein
MNRAEEECKKQLQVGGGTVVTPAKKEAEWLPVSIFTEVVTPAVLAPQQFPQDKTKKDQ